MERLRDKGLFYVLICVVFTTFFKDYLNCYALLIPGCIGVWIPRYRFISCLLLIAAFQLWQFEISLDYQSKLARCINGLEYQKVEMSRNGEGILNYCNQASVPIYTNGVDLDKGDHFWIHHSKLSSEINFVSKVDLIHPFFNKKSTEAPLYLALIKGDSKKLSHDQLGLFRAIGLGHFLALSGMHLAYVVLFLKLLFWRFRHRKWFQILELIVLASYLIYLDFPLSFSRAFAMYSIYVLAKLFKIRISGLNVILILTVSSLLIWPEIFFNLSFQFSFLAVGSIVYLWPKREQWRWSLNRKAAKLINAVLDPVYAAFFAQIPLVGLSLYYFKQFAFGGIIVSVLFTPILSLLLLCYYLVFLLELFGVQLHELQFWIQDHFIEFSMYFRKLGGFIEFNDISRNTLVFFGLITLVLILFLRRAHLVYLLLFIGLITHVNLFVNQTREKKSLLVYQSVFQHKGINYLLIEEKLPVNFSNNLRHVIHLKNNPKIHPGRFKESELVLIDYKNSPFLRESWMRYFDKHNISYHLVYGVPKLNELKKALEMRAL